MRHRILKTIILITFPILTFSQQKEADTLRVFYLGGQSNMDGYGYNTDLPNQLNKTFKNTWIFHGNPGGDVPESGGSGKWELLKPGHGVGFTSDDTKNNLSDRFGVELSFVKRIKELYPNEKIAIIKYSKGGTSIDSLAVAASGSWEPDYSGMKGVNQYDHFLATVKSAFSTNDIDGDGIKDILIPSGIIWMQGESDAVYSEEVAACYYSNLKNLMGLIRASFRTDDLSVVLGKISDSGDTKNGKVWAYGELVQYAQEKYVRMDAHASIVRSTKNYKYSDLWHYDSEGYIDLGKKFAEAIYQLNKTD